MSSRHFSLVVISGNGNGAGKTTLARKMMGTRVSLADAVRLELMDLYPGLPWFDRSQEAKELARPELGGASIRNKMIEHAEAVVKINPSHWANKLTDHIQRLSDVGSLIVVDDLRRMAELSVLKARYPHLVHFHIVGDGRHNPSEPGFDYDLLAQAAHYIVTHQKFRIPT